MQISYVVPRCTPDNSHGRYVIELARRFAGSHSVSVYSGAFSPTLRSAVKCQWLPIPLRPAVARLATLWSASVVACMRRPADIVHVQGADAPVGNVVTAHFCNRTMQGLVEGTQNLHRRINRYVGAAAERYCMSKPSTRRIIAVSETVKSDIEREYGVDPHKTIVIHHGVDSQVFHPRHRARWRVSVRDRLGLRRKDFVVLFVGADYHRKGLIPLLKAAQRVPAALKVLAVGLKPDATLAHTVEDKGLHYLVRFLGHCTDIAPLYAAADCFALPTRYDPFSLATLEAMASGLPVIVSRTAGVSELLTHDCDSLLLEDPDNVDVLAQILERLVRNDKLRTALSVQARNTAERHSWDEVAKQTLAVYRTTLMGSA
jgi:glycosyltransferase involved in cell wall biosynthesis